MVKGLYTAYTGMINEQNRMDIMTNNLANASTVGYKKEGSTSQSFDDVLTVKIKDQSVGMRNVQRLGVKNPGVKIGENYYIKGENFTEFSKVSLDGKILKTVYLGPTILALKEEVDPEDASRMKVSQVEKNKEILSTTE